MVRGTSQLKQHVLAQLPEELHQWVEQHIGFVDPQLTVLFLRWMQRKMTRLTLLSNPLVSDC